MASEHSNAVEGAQIPKADFRGYRYRIHVFAHKVYVEFAGMISILFYFSETSMAAFILLGFLLLGKVKMVLTIVLLVLAYNFIDTKLFGVHNRESGWYMRLHHWITESLSNYIPFRVVLEGEYDIKKKYLFMVHPHGTLYVGILMMSMKIRRIIKGIRAATAIHSSLFQLPVCRFVALALGHIPATRTAIKTELSAGSSVMISPGGVAEAYEAVPWGDINLVLKRRFGIFKIALEEGADLVPMLGFGENETYEQPKFALELRKKISRKLKRRMMTMVVGKPIDVSVVENPTREQVCELRDKYIDILFAMYDEWKVRLDHKDRKLVIIS